MSWARGTHWEQEAHTAEHCPIHSTCNRSFGYGEAHGSNPYPFRVHARLHCGSDSALATNLIDCN